MNARDIACLIIDDEDVDRYLMRRYLTRLGCQQVFEARDGEEALALLTRNTSDDQLVVFLDINMPRVDGFAVLDQLAALHEADRGHVLKVIMYSSSERRDDRERALENPLVVDYLVKGDLSQALLADRLASLTGDPAEAKTPPCQ